MQANCRRSNLVIQLYVLDPLLSGTDRAYSRWPVDTRK